MSKAAPTSYSDVAERMRALADRLLAINQAGGYSGKDARGVALSNCRGLAASSVMLMNILTMGEEGKISGDDFLKLIGLKDVTPQVAADILEKTTRLGFVVLFQFQLENLLANIHRQLHSNDPPRGFYMLAQQFARMLPDSARKLELLNTPALIRNSLHSNGIHHGRGKSSTAVEIEGVEFEFVHGQKVSCAGWGHLALAFGASLDVMEEILTLPAVASVADPLLDQYAWEEATEIAP